MAKLYPPYLEGTLPAFCLDVETGGGTLTIPFSHNKAVDARNDVVGIAVKIKTVQNDVLLTSFTTDTTSAGVYTDNDNGSGQVSFTVENFTIQDVIEWKIAIGQYYKIQLAYLYKGTKEIGYYSTVGVIKCTSTPEVTIVNFNKNAVNNNVVEFVGQFKQKAGGDITEKVYSSKFEIFDLSNNLIVSSGDILHNVENNPNSYTSQDTMRFNRDLEFGKIYKIIYSVITTNGLEINSYPYLIQQQRSLLTELKGKLIASLNYDEGYIDISFKGYVDENGVEEIGNGSFLLSREDSINPGVWEELYRFSFQYESPTKTIFRDFTIEQGKTYTYSIQQYNINKKYSDRKKSNQIYANFEDIFIYDGERQLKLRFNPQISSFKTQLAETRSETIGSKYPFFFRNARVGYKVFPVAGLISMQSDENEFFTSYSSILKTSFNEDRHNSTLQKAITPEVYKHTDLKSDNYVSERLFKLKVLDWINNGKVKLFKSPSEGNYLVRFMDTSLSPENGLGRMLHNLNSTAYECAECNYNNMVRYNIIEDTSSNEINTSAYVYQWREKDLGGYIFSQDNQDDSYYYSDNLIQADIENPFTTRLKFMDFMPGTEFRLVFSHPSTYDSKDSVDIIIGATGNYFADNIEKIFGIYLKQNKGAELSNLMSGSGIVTYEYQVPARNMFDLIIDTIPNIGRYKQIVGECKDVLESVNDIRYQITEITMSNYHKRPVEFLYYKENNTITPGYWWYDRDSHGYRKFKYSFNLYWDSNFNDDEIFDDKESLEYSPFSIYVLRNSKINGQDILNHLISNINEQYPDQNINEISHEVNHMFEKYYIDRYIASKSPEETLSNYSNIYISYLKAIENEENVEILEEFFRENPLYVLDAWNGIIYQVGVDEYYYKPFIVYNDSKIDLREIENYSLENLEVDECAIFIGNGCFGELFFQDIEKIYQLETSRLDEQVVLAKENWEKTKQNLRDLILSTSYTYQNYLNQKAICDSAYANYIDLLTNAVTNWTKRAEE